MDISKESLDYMDSLRETDFDIEQLKSERLRNLLNGSTPHKYLFYDSEFELVLSYLEQLHETIKNIEKRFRRNQTVRIARSLRQFLQLSADRTVYPQTVFNFQDSKVRICVVRLARRYHVYCDNYMARSFSDKRWHKRLDVYGSYEDIKDAIALFRQIVYDYLNDVELRFY